MKIKRMIKKTIKKGEEMKVLTLGVTIMMSLLGADMGVNHAYYDTPILTTKQTIKVKKDDFLNDNELRIKCIKKLTDNGKKIENISRIDIDSSEIEWDQPGEYTIFFGYQDSDYNIANETTVIKLV